MLHWLIFSCEVHKVVIGESNQRAVQSLHLWASCSAIGDKESAAQIIHLNVCLSLSLSHLSLHSPPSLCLPPPTSPLPPIHPSIHPSTQPYIYTRYNIMYMSGPSINNNTRTVYRLYDSKIPFSTCKPCYKREWLVHNSRVIQQSTNFS